jgi:hypothetical protein
VTNAVVKTISVCAGSTCSSSADCPSNNQCLTATNESRCMPADACN